MNQALPAWAQQMTPVDMDQAALLLGISRRFLIDAIKTHQHYERRGAKKVFYPEHIAKLKYALGVTRQTTHRGAILAFIASRVSPDKVQVVEAFFEENATGHVYIIRCGDRVKIGFTNKPADRMRVLRTACPYPIEEIAIFPGSREIEQFLHTALGAFRRHGEWFEYAGDLKLLVDEIEKMEVVPQ